MKYEQIQIDLVKPNDWNPNVCNERIYQKIKNGIDRVIKENGETPPIVVRKNQERYEIIDGYHRWKILQELGQKTINVYCVDANDTQARILTNQLNYNHGEADQEKYKEGILELIEMGIGKTELEELFPETSEELDQILEQSDLSVEAYETLKKEYDSNKGSDDEDDPWIEISFKLSVDQARVIEDEIKRISKKLKGKNVRSRALEYAMVLSSQTELPSDIG
jgi:ParB/RepB/Spo0J family partition protein